MTQRRLLILGALAIVVIAVALPLSQRHDRSSTADGDQLLYPELKAKLDSVEAVKVFKAGDAGVVEVRRTGTDWSVVDRSGYPADAEKVRKFLLAAAAAKRVEEKTSNPASYAALGVEDVTAATATGHRVEISGGGAPVNLIVGKQAGRSSQYVRRAGDQQSWQVSGSLDVPTTSDAWLRKDIIDVSSDRIQSFTVTIDGGKPWSAEKSARTASSFSVDGVPKGKELNSPSAADNISSALATLALADVRKASELQAQKPSAHTTFRTFDGLVAEVDGWAQDSKHYIALTTSYDAALAQRFKVAPAEPAKAPAAEGSAANDKTAPPPPAAPERNVAEESKSQNAVLAGWAYEIPDYKYEAIFKPLDELLKKPTEALPETLPKKK